MWGLQPCQLTLKTSVAYCPSTSLSYVIWKFEQSKNKVGKLRSCLLPVKAAWKCENRKPLPHPYKGRLHYSLPWGEDRISGGQHLNKLARTFLCFKPFSWHSITHTYGKSSFQMHSYLWNQYGLHNVFSSLEWPWSCFSHANLSSTINEWATLKQLCQNKFAVTYRAGQVCLNVARCMCQTFCLLPPLSAAGVLPHFHLVPKNKREPDSGLGPVYGLKWKGLLKWDTDDLSWLKTPLFFLVFVDLHLCENMFFPRDTSSTAGVVQIHDADLAFATSMHMFLFLSPASVHRNEGIHGDGMRCLRKLSQMGVGHLNLDLIWMWFSIAGYTALSNMPVRKTTRLEDGWIRDQFQTTPVMSTYLLAFVVADFRSRELDNGNGPLVRILFLMFVFILHHLQKDSLKGFLVGSDRRQKLEMLGSIVSHLASPRKIL